MRLDGLILAAGLGTRLGDIGSESPKALLEVGGSTLLERTALRLARAGCGRIVVNVHHHADRIEETLSGLADAGSLAGCGVSIVVSREPDAPLETGGGLKRAAPHFRPGHPVLIHNVDVISDIDLRALVQRHESSRALATLAVARRAATRLLVFDDGGLCGRIDKRTGREEWARRPEGETSRLGFTGIHIVSPEFLDEIDEEGTFSILAPYLRMAERPGRILPCDVTGCMWLDVGTPERLAAARERFARGSA